MYLEVENYLEKSWLKSLPFGRNTSSNHTIYKKFGQNLFIFPILKSHLHFCVQNGIMKEKTRGVFYGKQSLRRSRHRSSF